MLALFDTSLHYLARFLRAAQASAELQAGNRTSQHCHCCDMALDMAAMWKRELARVRAGKGPTPVKRQEQKEEQAVRASSRDTFPRLPKGVTHPDLAFSWTAELEESPALLDAAVLPACPATVKYLPDVISRATHDALVACVIDAAYKPKWVQLRGRRLQNWGGKPAPGGLQEAEELPGWLDSIAEALVRLGVFPPHLKPNHVLINEYLPGQGIMPHTDGPLYHQVVATLSLGAPARFTLRPRRGQSSQVPATEACLVLQPASLVVFSHDAYIDYEHSVEEDHAFVVPEHVANAGEGVTPGQAIERAGPRISLTIRHVPESGTADDPSGPPAHGAALAHGVGGGTGEELPTTSAPEG